MFRFHEFTYSNTLDFWRTYYRDPQLLKILAYANSVMGVSSGGYELLQDYDIMNIGAHTPGTVISWEPLNTSSYRYTENSPYPHSYFIPLNILSIQTLNDRLADPTVSWQNEVDFYYDEEFRGILRLIKDFPTEPLTIESGTIDGNPVYSDDGTTITLENQGYDALSAYAYKYKVVYNGNVESLEALSVRRGTSAERDYALNDDFLFDPSTGFIQFKLKPPTIPMYITKGTISETRLTDEIGRLMGYSRFDSREYRDSLETVSTSLMDIPSISNIKASISTAFRLASAKYGDETVTSLRNNAVTTDTYSYPLRGSSTELQLGDTLEYNAPVTSALELYTNRTHPNWWEDRLPELFQKYAEDVLTPSRRDIMMSTFLKNNLAHARLDITRVDTVNLTYQPDVSALTLDALPIRSDLIVTNYYHTEDTNMPEMDFEEVRLRHVMKTIWYGYTPPIDLPPDYYNSRTRVIHKFLAPYEQKDWNWDVEVQRYHLVGPNSQFTQFYSTERYVLPYIEPCLEQWWWRAVPSTDILMNQIIVNESGSIEEIRDLGALPGVLGSGAGGDYLTNIHATFVNEEIATKSISGFSTLDYSDFPSWTLGGLWLGVLGIVAPIGGSGHATSPAQDIGHIPKQIRLSAEIDTPAGTTYSLSWSTDNVTFTPYTLGTWVTGVQDNLYVRVTMTSNSYTYPILSEVNIEIKVN